jgi:hypothetical protein
MLQGTLLQFPAAWYCRERLCGLPLLMQPSLLLLLLLFIHSPLIFFAGTGGAGLYWDGSFGWGFGWGLFPPLLPPLPPLFPPLLPPPLFPPLLLPPPLPFGWHW